jgi:hypothetical protein
LYALSDGAIEESVKYAALATGLSDIGTHSKTKFLVPSACLDFATTIRGALEVSGAVAQPLVKTITASTSRTVTQILIPFDFTILTLLQMQVSVERI